LCSPYFAHHPDGFAITPSHIDVLRREGGVFGAREQQFPLPSATKLLGEIGEIENAIAL
jgi:hypothetical protein